VTAFWLPVTDAIWSYPTVDTAAQAGQSRPFCVRHAYPKSSTVMGVPSSHAAPGAIWYSTVCGSVAVIVTEASRSALSTSDPSGWVRNADGSRLFMTVVVSLTAPSAEATLKLGGAWRSATTRRPPARRGPALQSLGAAGHFAKRSGPVG
jgi:hypothetical protein